MREFESIKSRVELVAGEAVRRRIKAYEVALVQDIILAASGISKKREPGGERPRDLLIEAMRAELRDPMLGSGEENYHRVEVATE